MKGVTEERQPSLYVVAMDSLPLVTFAVLSILGMAVPGPDVVLAITNGSRYGIRQAFVGMAGVVLSDIVIVCSVAIGFGALLLASEFYLSAARMAGAAYLLFLGVCALRSAAKPKLVDDIAFSAGPGSSPALIVRCFVLQSPIRRLGCSFPRPCRPSSTSMSPLPCNTQSWL